jgi:hypothetical protein
MGVTALETSEEIKHKFCLCFFHWLLRRELMHFFTF